MPRGKIRPIISREFGWKEANEALEALTDKRTIGRTIRRYDGCESDRAVAISSCRKVLTDR